MGQVAAEGTWGSLGAGRVRLRPNRGIPFGPAWGVNPQLSPDSLTYSDHGRVTTRTTDL